MDLIRLLSFRVELRSWHDNVFNYRRMYFWPLQLCSASCVFPFVLQHARRLQGPRCSQSDRKVRRTIILHATNT